MRVFHALSIDHKHFQNNKYLTSENKGQSQYILMHGISFLFRKIVQNRVETQCLLLTLTETPKKF